ncbi:MAG: enoyl-CoA hydratase/isomerase family protein [Gemmatimonadota bacterium]
MTEGFVETAIENGIATVTFAHPRGNSLPTVILNGLAAAIRTNGERPDVAVVILRSAGDGAFCGGASFDELRAISDELAGREFFSGFARVILAMIECPRFIVTRVQGKVAGGGVGLVCASDYAIATPAAATRLSELALGIGPFVVGPVIEHRIGRGHFAAMAVDADWRDASWGERTGMFARVVPQSGLDSSVATLARTLAAFNPAAMTALKRVFWESAADWATLLPERAGISGRLILSAHARKAIGL